MPALDRDGAKAMPPSSLADAPVNRSLDGLPIAPLYPKAETPPRVLWRDGTRPLRVATRIDHPEPARARQAAEGDANGGAGILTLTCEGAATARGSGLTPEGLDAVLAGSGDLTVALRLEAPPFAAGEAVRRSLARTGRTERAIDWGVDPIGDMARCGAAPSDWPDLAAAARHALATLRRDGSTGPVFRSDGRPTHEAGGSEAQELAALLAGGVAYLRILEAAGLDGPAMQSSLSFTVAVDADQILGIAKLRALRLLWARVEEACGLAPQPIRLHAETAWRMVTRRDPATNLLRGTVACATAILGGADEICVLPDTAASGAADDVARRRARNVAVIALEEAQLGRVDDPAAGAGSFEALTGALCDAAWTLFQDVERAGGMAAALASGLWQARVAAARTERRALLASGAVTIVGTTAFVAAENGTVTGALPGWVPSPDPDWTRFEPLPCRRDDDLADMQG